MADLQQQGIVLIEATHRDGSTAYYFRLGHQFYPEKPRDDVVLEKDLVKGRLPNLSHFLSLEGVDAGLLVGLANYIVGGGLMQAVIAEFRMGMTLTEVIVDSRRASPATLAYLEGLNARQKRISRDYLLALMDPYPASPSDYNEPARRAKLALQVGLHREGMGRSMAFVEAWVLQIQLKPKNLLIRTLLTLHKGHSISQNMTINAADYDINLGPEEMQLAYTPMSPRVDVLLRDFFLSKMWF